MKKIFCFTLVAIMLLSGIQASASTKVQLYDFCPDFTATATGTVEEEIECDIHGGSDCLFLEQGGSITFDNPVEFIYVNESWSNECISFHGVYPEISWFESNECVLEAFGAERTDNESLHISEGETTSGKVEYLKKGARLIFKQPGRYIVFSGIAHETAEQRKAFAEKYPQEIEGYYSSYLCVTVLDDEGNVPPLEENFEEEIAEYDETLISIPSITGFEYDRPTVYYMDRVGICQGSAVIEVKKDLKMFLVCPVVNVNGNWEVDEETFYNSLEDSDFVYDAAYDGEIIPAKAGETYTITEPGLYSVFAEVDYMGEWTELVIEVVDTNKKYSAKYTDSKVMVDGKQVKFEAYNIADNNYFKLRDIAQVLSGTSKQFEIEWDDVNKRINMSYGLPYTSVGGELAAGDGLAKEATTGNGNISLDGETVYLKAYLINGNNYFKLRDLGKLFDFDVSWDGENNCVLIDSESYYTED